MRIRTASRDTGGPGDEEGNADAAFEDVAFLSVQGRVNGGVGVALGHRTAVVGDEEDERAFALAGGLKGGDDAPHGFVDGGDHGRVGAAAGVGDGREFFQHILTRLERSVGRVESEIEEPRFRVAGVAGDGGCGLFAEARGEFADLGDGRGIA